MRSILKLIHTTTSDTTQTRLFCCVWCGGVNYWVGPTARQVRSVSGLCRSVSGGAVRPPDALRRRTHLSGCRADSSHTATPDKKRLSRLPVDRRRRDAGQAGSVPPPDRPHAATLHDTQKCKHCCIGPNFFTKRHATRASYRFNSSDFARRSRDSIHTAWHDTDNTVLSRLAGGVNWALESQFDSMITAYLTVGSGSARGLSSVRLPSVV